MVVKKLIKELEIGIAEFILLIIIILSFLDAFELLSIEFDYIKKLISWIGLGYLFYKASITNLIVGNKHKHIDWILVIAYFFFMFKDFTGFIVSSFKEAASSNLSSFYYFIISNRHALESYTFYIAGILILLLSIYISKLDIHNKSILYILHEKKKSAKVSDLIIRFLTIYFALIGFYFVVFNLIMEWLAIAIDSILVVMAVIFYIYLIAKHKKKFNATALIYRAADIIEIYYDKFIKLFKKKETIGLAITCLLVLHIFTDIINFLIPYLFGIHDSLYFEQFGAGHLPIVANLIKDFALVSGFNRSTTFIVYLLNTFAIFMLFLGPGYLWWHIYKHKHSLKIEHTNWYWLFFGSIAMFLIMPVFKITRFDSKYIIGVDVLTNQIKYLANTPWAVLVCLLVMTIIYILSIKHLHRIVKLAFITIQIFFGFYLYHFFMDTAKYYINGVIILIQNMKLFLGFHLFIFLIITLLFYIGGFVLFVYECNTKDLHRNTSHKTKK